MDIIKINNLTKDYGNKKGIFNVNISIKKGEVFGFLGPNGAGKTTTIRNLMGFIRPDSGTCSILGMDCFKESEKIKEKLGYLAGEIAFFDDLTGIKLLNFLADMKGIKDKGKMNELIERFELDPRGKVKKMSKGMKQKIGIISAFMSDAEVFILDEPTSGLDPLMQNRFVDLVLEEKKKGKTILMSSHIFEEIEKTCDRTAIIRNGKIVAIDRFNYGGITNIKRTSNFIGKSNTTSDNLFKGILNNFKITIYASTNAIPIYRSALYEFDTTSTDFGRPLYLELKTKGINMNYPQHLKKLKHIFVKVVGGYNYGELFFTLYGDGYIVNDPKTYTYYIDENGTVVQEYVDNKDLTIDEKISLLGNMRLDKTKLGEGLYQTRKLVIPRKAKNFAILISGDSSDYVSLESIGYVCKLGKVKES